MSHRYQVGQKVQLKENGEEGVIIGLLWSEQVDEDMDPGEPWYEIEWDVGFDGQEHEDSIQ